ncbi:PREDICTED: uncharacterized protein LOC108366872 isoform X2 [Rhagoletis zephyria]|uniref:uncharacterized protein LOC108366872 isoform X2 n=1 Tax=Rhagoletis zephyria TaxID=28612 RepID=UPI00081131D4|nr:PREDICTED: uncharacterized protein LOC108366872 isoform X2 [Rhagoletis zephyria]
MAVKSTRKNEQTAESETQPHGNETETRKSKSMDTKLQMSTQIKTTTTKTPQGMEDHTSLLENSTPPTSTCTNVLSSTLSINPKQQLLRKAISTCWQKTLQLVTTNTGKPANNPSAKYFNWSYRLLRRKQLIFLLIFVIFIFYLGSSIRDGDNTDESVHVLHYSHVPGMKGFLVWSESCRIPVVDVYAPDIMQHFKREKYKPCSKKKPLTTVTFNTTSKEYLLQIEKSEIKSFGKSGRIRCCYQPIIRNGTGAKADEDYKLGKCVPFKDSVSLSAKIENILVQCDSNKRNVYKNGHPLISEKPDVLERLKTWREKDDERGGTKPPSVLMIGIDSISRVNLIRAMPKTAQHLYDNDWFELSGYNKIDDNTFPNLMALLAGYNKYTTVKKCPPKVLGALDNCSLIWNTFREHGYVTGYGEDAAEISTFNYYKVGFVKPPVDYYLRPFQLAAEHHLYKTLKSGLTFCLGYQQSAQFVLDYAIEFATRFKDHPLFGLFWANSFSHNNLSDASSMDVVVLNYLQRLEKLGILDRSIVVFFSDHGLRFGPARATTSGHMEERLPFIFIWLPPYLKQKYPSFVNALSVNKNRLTTPYDLHMTLKHFLRLSERIEDKDKASVLAPAEGCTNCQTLLEPVPLDRSCNDAAIDEHWCTCIPYRKVNKNMHIVQKLGTMTVNYINELVRNFNNGSLTSLCRSLQLGNVISAHRSCKDFRPKDANGTALDVYRLHLITKPNSADFEVTLRYNPATETIKITGEISRLNTYFKDSHCVADSFVKKYCSCA